MTDLDDDLVQRMKKTCDGLRFNGNDVFWNLVEIYKEVPRKDVIRVYEDWRAEHAGPRDPNRML